ncbi:MAG TPA: glycosyltransferase [Pseudomonadales bacterium]
MRVFVLSTGRSGTTTFTHACNHITNFTAGHETRARFIGPERLNYPDNHIEIDNRLSWFLGRLDQAFGDAPYFVHLTREPAEVAASLARRMNNPVSISAGHKTSILMNAPYDDLEICLDLTETMLTNIEHFLRGKTKVMHVRLENIEEDFSRFWDWIGAEGDKAAALAEWRIRYNDSENRHGMIPTPVPETELSELRQKVRALSDENRKLRSKVSSGRVESRHHEQELARLRDAMEMQAAQHRTELEALEGRLAAAERSRQKHIEERDAFIRYADELERVCRRILASGSWKVMGPYRVAMRTLKSLVLRRRVAPNRLPSRPVLGALDGKPRKAKQPSPAQALEDKLWGGFSRSALQDLDILRSDPKRSPKDRSDAAFRLARWHSVHGNFDEALKEIKASQSLNPSSARGPRRVIPEALLLCRLGRVEEARSLIEAADVAFDPTVRLILANTWNPAVSGDTRTAESERKVLDHVNSIYETFGLSPIEKRDHGAPLSIDNIRGVAGTSVDAREKVTVIMPVFNARDTIVTAMTSIAEQSWSNLEVLVVDDASTDDSAEVIADFCSRDQRFRLIRGKENVGSYVCRNLALEVATGDLVTVHDSDDWSHPDKIRCQVEALRSNPAPYNLAMWVRTTTELAFFGNAHTLRELVRPDHSSGLFPRETFRRFGAWDAVRVSADTELYWRIERLLGNEKRMMRRRQVLPECPLAFGRIRDSSLTQSAATRATTIYHGMRREYRDAADCWHAQLGEIEDPNPAARRKPFFPVPSSIVAGSAPGPVVSTLLIADWNAPEMTDARIGHLKRLAALGSTGLLHYPRYESDVAEPLDHDVRRVAWANDIRVIVPGESVRATNVIILAARVFEHALDRFPTIAYERLFVVAGSLNRDPSRGEPDRPDLVRARRHLVEFFGGEGDWFSSLDEVLRMIEEESAPSLDSTNASSPGRR